MHYFIDGYNLIRSADWLATGPLRAQRERLLKFLNERRPQGGAANRVTVVFDGRIDVSSPRTPGEIEVVFSEAPDTDADAVIKRRVDALGRPREAAVVTDDRAIQRWVRGAGARVVSCADFLKAGAPARPARPAAEGAEPDGADAIDDEFRKLWDK